MDKIIIINIKGMLCGRCIALLSSAIGKAGARLKDIRLGQVELYHDPALNLAILHHAIRSLGFEVLEDKQEKLVNTIKRLVQEAVDTTQLPALKITDFLRSRTNSSYDTVSSTFAAAEGMTLEHYIIKRKIERVKQLLLNTEMSLTDISFHVNYSSVHHLSRQFKEKTGMNPTSFRQEYRTTIKKQP